MSGWKVRLGDGSEIGPMDLAALRTWLAQGLVDGDSPVMRPGSRKWLPLSTISELKGAVGVSRPKAKKKGRAKQAGAVYRADLEEWPKNGWSLFGLSRALLAQQKTDEAAWADEGFERAWARADVQLSASRF